MTNLSNSNKKDKLSKKDGIAEKENKPADIDVAGKPLMNEYKCATSTDPNDWGPRDGPFPTD